MAITTRDQLIAALANSRHVLFDKSSIANAVAGRFYSLWRANGQPVQGAIPTAAAFCDRTLQGALGMENPITPLLNYLAWVDVATGNATSTLEIHDRLCHQGGLSGTIAAPTAQITNLPLTLAAVPAERIGAPDHSQLQWWLEWYADTGSTGVSATVNVTYSDDTSGNVTVLLAATSRASGLYQILPFAAGKTGIKAVNSVTLSATTGTAGNFGVTCTRYRAGLFTVVANKAEVFDWAALALPEIANDSCLALLQLCTTTTTGISKGVVRFAAG
ncbi:hypothetical protein KQ313_07930 [Synechococcus sp. CS-1325]|uniref:hypothetical protein n=1 Tax=Synechococcus sp. CS-1325 TaxID=2847979 RepID=UPI000DB73F70|nr:hypothetical protein [Synechococcus sp. CS-1325]MCT0199603.1 hypothetical protein [Synechococcus sp. CS-1325]PZV02751.1 MAG: hypothetical protein DCF24_00820 [Cyanobium sp.]